MKQQGFQFKKKKRVIQPDSEKNPNQQEKQIFAEISNSNKQNKQTDQTIQQNDNQQNQKEKTSSNEKTNQKQQQQNNKNTQQQQNIDKPKSNTMQEEIQENKNDLQQNNNQNTQQQLQEKDNTSNQRDSYKKMQTYYPDVEDDYDIQLEKFINNKEVSDCAYSFILFLQEKETQRIQDFLDENEYYKEIHSELLSNIKLQLNQLKHQYKRRVYDSRPLIKEEHPENLKQQFKLILIKKIGSDLIQKYHNMDKEKQNLQENPILKQILQELFQELKNSQNTLETSITEERIMEENINHILENMENNMKEKLKQRQQTIKDQAQILDKLQLENEKMQEIQKKLYEKFLGDDFEQNILQWDDKEYLINQEKEYQQSLQMQ